MISVVTHSSQSFIGLLLVVVIAPCSIVTNAPTLLGLTSSCSSNVLFLSRHSQHVARTLAAGPFLHMCVLCLRYFPSVPTYLPVLQKYLIFTIYSDNRQDG